MSRLEKQLENETPWWELEKREFIPVYGFVHLSIRSFQELDSAKEESLSQENGGELYSFYRELLFHRVPRIALLGVYNCAIAGLVVAADYFSR